MTTTSDSTTRVLDTSLKVFEFFQPIINDLQEEVWVVALNSHLDVIGYELIFRGTVDACGIHPRDIFRFLISRNASSFILVHNHPSGDPTPSVFDFRITRQIARAAKIIEIAMIDHVIVTKEKHFSFAEQNLNEKRRPGTRRSLERHQWALPQSLDNQDRV